LEKFLISAFVAVESAHAFSAFCPSVFTIKTFAVDDEKRKQVRLGYVPAVIFSLVLSVICSKLVKSWMPLGFGVFTMVFMVCAYEFALRLG
jgi:ABC-type phosphate transport system permease subunit